MNIQKAVETLLSGGIISQAILGFLPAVLIIGSREYLKALISTKLGDNMPKARKRLNPNPFSHLDAIGMIFMLFWGYGFANPVETSSLCYKDRKKGTLIVYVTSVLFTFALGIAFFYAAAVLAKFSAADSVRGAYYYFAKMSFIGAELAVKYAVFSLVPVYPLDGAKILSVILKPHTVIKMSQYEKILQIGLVFMILFGFFDYIIEPLVIALFGAISF